MLFIKDDVPAVDGLYYQCRLEQKQKDGGLWVVVAWIDAKCARRDLHLTLKGEEGWWTVKEIYVPPQSRQWLLDKQAADRKGLRSIRVDV